MTESIHVIKSSSGLRKMLLISSNAYEDREKEIVREKALKRYVANFEPNDLLYWHGGDPIGRIIEAEMEGPFLIEIAEELPNQEVNLARADEPPLITTVKEVWNGLEDKSDDTGASIGFKYFRGDKDDGMYEDIFKKETSVLPISFAANAYTHGEIVGANSMTDERTSIFEKWFGGKIGKQKRDDLTQAADALDKAGVARKELPPEEKPVNQEEETKMDTGALADQVIAMLSSEGSPEDKKAALVALLNDLIGTAEPEEMPAAEMGKEAKALGNLLDTLVKTQDSLAADQTELKNAVKALTPMNALADEFKALKAELFSLKAQLSARPRAASRAPETTFEDTKMLEEIKKQVETLDPFWGGSPAN